MSTDLQKQILRSMNESPNNIYSIKEISELSGLDDVREFEITEALEEMEAENLVKPTTPDKSGGEGYLITAKGSASLSDR